MLQYFHLTNILQSLRGIPCYNICKCHYFWSSLFRLNLHITIIEQKSPVIFIYRLSIYTTAVYRVFQFDIKDNEPDFQICKLNDIFYLGFP